MTELCWGRTMADPGCAHVREMRDGHPVTYNIDGYRVGSALCGTFLVGDVAPGNVQSGLCRVCPECEDLLRRIND